MNETKVVKLTAKGRKMYAEVFSEIINNEEISIEDALLIAKEVSWAHPKNMEEMEDILEFVNAMVGHTHWDNAGGLKPARDKTIIRFVHEHKDDDNHMISLTEALSVHSEAGSLEFDEAYAIIRSFYDPFLVDDEFACNNTIEEINDIENVVLWTYWVIPFVPHEELMTFRARIKSLKYSAVKKKYGERIALVNDDQNYLQVFFVRGDNVTKDWPKYRGYTFNHCGLIAGSKFYEVRGGELGCITSSDTSYLVGQNAMVIHLPILVKDIDLDKLCADKSYYSWGGGCANTVCSILKDIGFFSDEDRTGGVDELYHRLYKYKLTKEDLSKLNDKFRVKECEEER
jgi:hypothetical protein